MLGRILTTVVALILAGGLAWALWPRPIEVETATIGRGSLEVLIEEEGKTRIRDVFTVSTPVAGRLQRLDLKAGDRVMADKSILATVRPVDPGLLDERSLRVAQAAAQTARAAVDLSETQVAQAKRQHEFAERVLERTTSLLQRGVVSDDARDKAQFEHDAATAALKSAEATQAVRQRELQSAEAALFQGVGSERPELCCVEVKAPVSGQILQVLTQSEQVVQAGTPLLSIGDPANLEIAVELPSEDAVRLEPGARATIDGWGGPQLSAELTRIEPMAVTKVSALGIEEQRTTVTLRLLGPYVQWQRLGHGFRVVAHIARWHGDDRLLIPIGALFRVDQDWATFIVSRGRAVTRRVEIGERNAALAEVVAGLNAGDEVILHPADVVTDGSAVTSVRSEPGEAL